MEIPITVIMSVYNEKKSYLKESIESILKQSFSDFEFIIIDDGSNGSYTREILQEYEKKDGRIKIYKNKENLGLTKSLNIALAIAKGKYVARIDSDDIAELKRLEKQLNFMEKNPDYALCGSWVYFIDENSKIIGEKKCFSQYEKIRKKIIYYNFLIHSSFFFRRDLAVKLGGYNEEIKKAQDYDFILKLSARHPVAAIPEFLGSFRLHPKSISAKSRKKQEWFALIARFNAIRRYGYSKLNFFKIIPSIFYFLFVPCFLEKKIFKILYKKKRVIM